MRERLGLGRRGPEGDRGWGQDIADKLGSFQQVHGLEETGRANRDTIEALNRDPDWYMQTIERNIERARLLPRKLGDRYVLVDLAAQELRAYDHGARELHMRVIQGRDSMQTPMLADRIETIVANPYWNLPPDIVRKTIAPAVLSEGPSWLDRRDYEVLSDWSDDPKPVDSADVDWQAVADGSKLLRVRQRPGPENAMGSVKFMFPNPLGIYLHDTPRKNLFEYADRRLSHGCVRLEKPEALAEFLVQGDADFLSSNQPNNRVRLADPVPVYTGYFTAWPGKDGLTFHEDVYQLDKAMELTEMPAVASRHQADTPSRKNG
ncbi:L,D-transpeptidase family protein [Altericroceibacterium xinjiangense]|uniref:L,D-transpeptidase family protein n=1 Tax=Altericroceibacterium xinjiangense TaxID=762261 RepID=UPI000F7F97DA|nr:L,D-transpeptidase family protein [Altericroceibacterium xinjiangense]